MCAVSERARTRVSVPVRACICVCICFHHNENETGRKLNQGVFVKLDKIYKICIILFEKDKIVKTID